MLGGTCLLAALALVAGLSVRAAWGMYQKFEEAAAADAASQTEVANLKSQYDDASQRTEFLNTKEGQEQALRERYGVAAPGEGEIDIVRPAEGAEGAAAAPQGFWQKLWHALFVW